MASPCSALASHAHARSATRTVQDVAAGHTREVQLLHLYTMTVAHHKM